VVVEVVVVSDVVVEEGGGVCDVMVVVSKNLKPSST
jgi:hypothetical protein